MTVNAAGTITVNMDHASARIIHEQATMAKFAWFGAIAFGAEVPTYDLWGRLRFSAPIRSGADMYKFDAILIGADKRDRKSVV